MDRAFGRGSQTGDASSGIGLAWKILRVCRAIHRAEVFAFLHATRLANLEPGQSIVIYGDGSLWWSFLAFWASVAGGG